LHRKKRTVPFCINYRNCPDNGFHLKALHHPSSLREICLYRIAAFEEGWTCGGWNLKKRRSGDVKDASRPEKIP